MTNEEFNGIIREIVMQWPQSECNQIDTYLNVGSLDELTLPDAGKTLKDYEKGDFFGREFVNQGSSRIVMNYPMLVTQHVSTQVDCCDFVVNVGIWDKLNCSDCDCDKGVVEVTDSIIGSLKLFNARLMEYRLRRKDGNIIWSADSSLPQDRGATGMAKSHLSLLSHEDISIIQFDRKNNVWFAYIQYRVRNSGCISDTSGFEPFNDVDVISEVICKSCKK